LTSAPLPPRIRNRASTESLLGIFNFLPLPSYFNPLPSTPLEVFLLNRWKIWVSLPPHFYRQVLHPIAEFPFSKLPPKRCTEASFVLPRHGNLALLVGISVRSPLLKPLFSQSTLFSLSFGRLPNACPLPPQSLYRREFDPLLKISVFLPPSVASE